MISTVRGRKPKPIRQQINEGDPSKVGKHKLEKKLETEPKATRGLPSCPKHLKGIARAAWNFWHEELTAMRLDARPDAQMLEGACVAYGRAVKADQLLETDALLIVEPIFDKERKVFGSKLKSHPAVAISNCSWRNVRSFCSEFGLSPVSRTRLTLEKSDSSGVDLFAILSRPRERKPNTDLPT